MIWWMLACGGRVEPIADGPVVRVETSLGEFSVVTFESQAPGTTDNFLRYIEEGFYDGSDGLGATQFHRVVPGFVVQGGGLDAEGVEKDTHGPIPNESKDSGLRNDLGTLAMARKADADSATAQWFVNVVDNPVLDRGVGYSVFGEVTAGLDVVLAMTDLPLIGEQPEPAVMIEAVTVVESQ